MYTILLLSHNIKLREEIRLLINKKELYLSLQKADYRLRK